DRATLTRASYLERPKSTTREQHSCCAVERRSSFKANIPFADLPSRNRWRAEIGPQHAQSHPPRYGPAAGLRRWGRSTVSVRYAQRRALWATDRVRHPPVVAPSGGSSNTGGATPSSCEERSPPLVDDCAVPRWPDGNPKTQAHGGRSMSFYRGMTCENVTIQGDKGTPITAYVARPSGHGPFPGVVLVQHLPGWSEFYIETTPRFAHHGHLAICANLYEREGGGSDGNPDDVAAKVRAEGGIADSQMVGDTEAAVKWMRAQPNHNGKVGLFGSCSGGRHAFI